MRKRIPLILLFTGLILVACISNRTLISLEVTEIDLGDVFNGEVIIGDVAVGNEGAVTLVVDCVSTSCGCTLATLNSMNIEPGESATRHIEIDSGAHGAELNGLRCARSSSIAMDPQGPEALIKLAANVKSVSP